MAKKFFPLSIQNYIELSDDDKYCDVTIEAGEDPNVKIFRAHSNILHYRFPFLRQFLVNKRHNNGGDLARIKLPDITPEIFRIILKYIYSGILHLDEENTLDIFDTLIAAEELHIQELTDYLQSYLTENKMYWLINNFELIYQASFQSDRLSILQQTCIDIMAKSPKKIFKIFDFKSLPEKVLVQLIERDDLQMEEIEVWDHILNWGLAQNTTILSPDPNTWTDDDFKTMKDSLQKCLPLIRFFNLSSKEFTQKIIPYRKLLSDKLYNDLSNSYSDPDCIPNESISLPRNIRIEGMFDSKIVNLNIISIISRWIDKMNFNSNFAHVRELYLPYKFKLLLRGSRDGFNPKVFHKLCDDKPNTVVFIKIKGTEKIVGGYNPLEWKSSDSWGSSGDSFIFSFKDDNDFRDAILSKVKDKDHALRFHHDAGPYFGQDIVIYSSNKLKNYDKTYLYAQMCYEKAINDTDGKFSIEDYEVFQLSHSEIEEAYKDKDKDKEDAFGTFKELAEKGNPDAQIKLAYCYNRGIGTEINNGKAFEIYKGLVEKGYLEKRPSLKNYIGTQLSNVLTFELCKKLAQKGSVAAQNNLGTLYFEGEGTNKDLMKAIHWYRKSSEGGNELAQYNLGTFYELGVEVEKDKVKAFELYKKSAENGYINAKFHLGYCYVNGIGVEADKKKGLELYNNAALKESEETYVNGKSLSNDLYRISYWYRKAAKAGGIDSKIALYKLGEFHEFGVGVIKSRLRAFDYYKQSADKGYAAGKYKLGYFCEHGIGVCDNKEKAFEFYRAAAEEGNSDAQRSLASLYERGEGTEKNIESAVYWYKEAVKKGNVKARESLNNIILNNNYKYI